MVEGGGELTASLIKARLVDKVFFFIAPIIIGGKDAVTSVQGEGAERINKALKLADVKYKRIKNDLLVEADVYWNS